MNFSFLLSSSKQLLFPPDHLIDPVKECLYNILIMEEKQTIAACGAGTTTKVYFTAENRIERAENVKEVEQYIDRIDEMIGRKEKLLGRRE